MRSPTVSMKLLRIVKQSENNPDMVFTTLAHHLDVDFLREAYLRLKKKAAAGVDKVSHKDYGNDLEKNLADLHFRLKANRYRALPTKRVWIDKDDGSKRGLGIPVLEDKIVQKAVALILESVYEPIFKDFSYGFRPKRSAHDALRASRDSCFKEKVNWIVDADIKGFFDNISHKYLLDIFREKVNDGALLRLIGKWLKAGVLDGCNFTNTDKGTPQGGVISPILANIYLHSVVDKWFDDTVKSHLTGKCFIVRFADDFVIGCQYKVDAEKIFQVLPKRFARFGLEIHPDKSHLIKFKRPYRDEVPNSGTFDFLGFTHFWGKTLKGNWTIKRKTRSKTLRRFMSGIWEWCKFNRHESLVLQCKKLTQKLRGHYNYFAVRGNYKMLEVVYEYARKSWRRWLARRCSKDGMIWEKFERKVARHFPLPMPRIKHNF